MDVPTPSGSNLSINFSNDNLAEIPRLSVPVQVSLIINTIINSITCPFTVLFNVLVILAVKRRPTLQSYANILLACLAATDTATGLLVQPSFILFMIMRLLGIGTEDAELVAVINFHNSALRAMLVCSSLHVMLVTYERIIAIKFTLNYHTFVTKNKIKIAVTVFWFLSVSSEVLRHVTKQTVFSNVLTALTLVSCVLFISISYLLLYQETRRHHKKMKSEQVPQEEVERFRRESKALKTTVFVVGAVLLCFSPSIIILSFVLFFPVHIVMQFSLFYVVTPFIHTSGMLNSFLNPLIYCLRQKEMRTFVLNRFSTPMQAVHQSTNQSINSLFTHVNA